MDDYIKIKKIEFQYPGTNNKQLRNISLDIKQYEITVFAGQIGSGKSTLLRLINGINRIQKGDILVNSSSIKQITGVNYKQMGFLFENPDHQIFYPIVADDIAFGPRNLGLSKSEINSRVVQACRDVEILHLLERETSSLSLGEKTLVAIAGVLSMRPEILLLDGPGVGLDIWTKSRMTKLLQELTKQSTLIISSNDTEFLEIANRIFLLHNGKIVGKYKNYQNFRKSLARREGVLHQDLES